MALKQKNIGSYDKLMKELDNLLEQKVISYAQFAKQVGWQTVAFYNRYKVYGFDLEEMERFVLVARVVQPNMIICIRCSQQVVPKAKSVRRVICEDCKVEISMMKEEDSLRYKYPPWVNAIRDSRLRELVEQEFHIDEITAHEMSLAGNIVHAKMIRDKRWELPIGNIGSSLSKLNVLLTKIN